MINSIKYLHRFRRNISFLGLFNAFRFFIRIKNIPQVDILYACHDNSRSVLLNGKYYSPLIDGLILKLNDYSNITLALPFSKYSANKTNGNTINLNLYVIAAIIKRFFTSGSFALKNKKNDPLIRFYNKLYQKLNLKLIIAIQPSIEMCIAAKRNKIKIMDLQHGIIETKNSNSYYSLDKRFLHQNSGWPDYILCRNKQSYQTVLNLKDYTKPFLIGNLNKIFYQNVFPSKKDNKLVKTKAKTILYTFQPTYTSTFSSDNFCEGIIFPNELYKLILTSKYNFILKLHPSQIHKKGLFKLHIKAFHKLFSKYKNVDFRICNQKPIEYSLAKSDIHITFNSAVLFDAMDYDLKTILLDDNLIRLKHYFGELIDTDSVIVDPKLKINFSKHFYKVKKNKESHALNDINIDDFISSNLK